MSARHLKKVISRPDSLETVNLKTVLRCLEDVLLRRGFQQLSPQYHRDKKEYLQLSMKNTMYIIVELIHAIHTL